MNQLRCLYCGDFAVSLDFLGRAICNACHDEELDSGKSEERSRDDETTNEEIKGGQLV
jgi:hypothetical protein